MKLCEKLYELRRAAGLSQEELAERLNVSRQAVSKWENGAAQPELSKLVELSRLYGVSVDELLSLEEAEKGDAKAASSVETSTPAPAQETLTAPKKARRQKLLLGAAAVCLALAVGLALYNNHRVKQLERQVGSLQSQIMSVQSSLSSQIAGISSSVREAMEESATLTAQFDYTVKRFDLDAYTCTVAFALQPKTVQDDLAVSLRLRSLASDDGTTAVELIRDEYDVYRGEAVLSMNDDGFEATAAYDTGGERQLETIRDLPGFANEALPKLYEDLSFGYGYSQSYSSSVIRCSVKGWEDPEDHRTADLYLGAYDADVRSAWLDYRVDGKSAAQSTLRFMEVDDKRSAVQWWISDIPDESTAGVYSIYGAEGVEFGLPYGAELQVVFHAELTDGTRLSAMLTARDNALRQQQRRRRERRTGNAHCPHEGLIRSGNAARRAAFFFAPLAPKRPGNVPQPSEILTEKGLAKPSRCAMMRPKRSARRAHFRKRG